MLVTLYKIGEVYFRLLGTSDFHVKRDRARDLKLQARVVVKTSNMEFSRRYLADYVKKLHHKACRTCRTIIFPYSTNQIIDLWRCRCRSRRRFLDKTSLKNKRLRNDDYFAIIGFARILYC